jgi:voltage-gated potassium channel Kch
MNAARHDRYSLMLLISLIVFLILSSFVSEHHLLGDVVLAVSIYVTLITGTLELSQKRNWLWPGTLVAGISMLIMLVHFFYPGRLLMVANWIFLAAFLGFVSVALFSYLGLPGSVTSGRLYGLVSLYLMLGVFYFAIFNLIETVHPHSFMETAFSSPHEVSRHSLLYLSLITLTTLGYGDIVPVTPQARLVAALEATTGVLYIAITVARLVSAYQKEDKK